MNHVRTLYILCLFALLAVTSCSRKEGAPSSTAPLSVSVEIDTAALANGHDYVDLGFCNGLCWGTMNVGANHVDERGSLFFWGEGDRSSRTIDDFQLSKYPLGDPITKYITEADDYREQGYLLDPDGKLTLEPSDDAARVNWGGGWRMPYREEIDSLLALCSWEKDVVNGLGGYRVTSMVPGYTDRSIFLPFTGAGAYFSIIRQNQGVYLWSKQVVEDPCSLAWGLVANEEYIARSSYARVNGQAVRPVFLPGEVLVEQVTLDKTRLQMTIGDPSVKLSAQVLPTHATRQELFWFSSDKSIASVDHDGNVSACSPGWCYISAISTDGTSLSGICRVEVIDPVPLTHDCVPLIAGNLLRWATADAGASCPEEEGPLFTLAEARSIRWGDHWRLPTADELEELRNICGWKPVSYNDVRGLRFWGNKANMKYSVFLPSPSSGSQRSYWSDTESGVAEGMQSIMTLTADTAFWSYCPDTCRHAVRLVYSLSD